MGFFDKTRYLKTLLFLLPIGLVMLFYGIKYLSRDIDDLQKHVGNIERIEHIKTISSYKNQSYFVPTTLIKFYNYDQIFCTTVEKYKNAIDSTLSIGDKVVIWTYNSKRANTIAQIIKDENYIVIYHKNNIVSLGLLILGIIVSFIAIGYLIKYTEDLLGRKK